MDRRSSLTNDTTRPLPEVIRLDAAEYRECICGRDVVVLATNRRLDYATLVPHRCQWLSAGRGAV